ncbi:MAG: ExbD/TolR family protein [Thermodesulfobacteriota bacterium]
MRFSQPKKEEISLGVSMAPLIDIVFLLLIFFMLTSHIDIVPGIDMVLPEISQKGSDTAAETMIVAIDRQGSHYLNKEKIELNELFKTFEKTAHPGKTSLIVQADRDVKHGHVVRVLDLAKKAGINRIVIAAQWEPEHVF